MQWEQFGILRQDCSRRGLCYEGTGNTAACTGTDIALQQAEGLHPLLESAQMASLTSAHITLGV